MPRVHVSATIEADIEEVWKTVCDVEEYPRFMESVEKISVLDHSAGERTIAWRVLLKGSVLEWSELERIDPVKRRIEFHQLDGDLDRFEGHWQLDPTGTGGTRVELDIRFEIGMPLLAPMLNPVAERALRDNSENMLRALEQKSRGV